MNEKCRTCNGHGFIVNMNDQFKRHTDICGDCEGVGESMLNVDYGEIEQRMLSEISMFDYRELHGKTLKIRVGQDTGSDGFTALVVIGVDVETEKMYVLHSERLRAKNQPIIDEPKDLNIKHMLETIKPSSGTMHVLQTKKRKQ